MLAITLHKYFTYLPITCWPKHCTNTSPIFQSHVDQNTAQILHLSSNHMLTKHCTNTSPIFQSHVGHNTAQILQVSSNHMLAIIFQSHVVHNIAQMLHLSSNHMLAITLHKYFVSSNHISRVSGQNGVSQLYIIVKIYPSGWEPLIL